MRFLRDESKFAQGKIAFLQYLSVAVFLIIVGGYWNLQIRNEELYSLKAERNRIKALPIPAPRGKILDRDNRVIVDNHSSFSVLLSRETVKDEHLKPIGFNYGFNEGGYAGQRVFHFHFHILPRFETDNVQKYHLFHRKPEDKIILTEEEMNLSVEEFRKIF